VSARTHRPSLGSDLLATTVVAAFSMTVAVGYARVFTGWPFLADMATIVVAGHGVGLIVRRVRLTAWLAVPATALVLAWTVLAVYYAAAFSWGLPTSDTWTLLGDQLVAVREEFRTAVAPVDYAGGWDVLAAIGLAMAVLLADVFAFRADARAETLVPGGVLFVFVGALGDDRLRILTAVVVVGVGALATATLRGYHADDGRGRRMGVWQRWPAALAVGMAVALIAGVVGPRLPGADAAPLYETTGGGGGGVTQVLSPLVDIRSRLTNRSTDELFRVRADAESYWRSSALPDFDGTTWGLPERELRRVDGPLTAPVGSLVENRQLITIGALGGSLVPAAPDPFEASGPDDLRFVAETSTLVTVDDDLATGDTIEIVSATPVLDPARLAAATSAASPDPIHVEFPAGLPAVVEATAREVTAGATSTYDVALRLQMWFQTEFQYSLEVRPGHGNSAIESFLRDRIGYCEQFAGTYAAMLRTLGIPTRVAVGFTSGVPLGDGEFAVLGRNAHAWPEVWFDDIGWVAFEPTPGRGAPNAQGYTGLAPQQDTSATADEIVSGEGESPTSTLPTETPDPGDGLQIPDFEQTPDDAAPAPVPQQTDGSAGGGGGTSWWLPILVGLVGVALLAPTIVRWARHRRRSQSVDEQLADAWRRATGAVAAVGVPVRACDTPSEVAARTARHFPLVSRPMASLAAAVTEATYRAEGSDGFDVAGAYGASTIRECRNWAKQIDRAATESMDTASRIRRSLTTWR
jgi:transglutaminase-like putative cysteine protease